MDEVDSRAANIRAGYVYVISNIGAFGERMVKIGMTRRLEPMDRVRELGDASVPFRFDVHALFFSDDAVARRRSTSAGRRKVNMVNAARVLLRHPGRGAGPPRRYRWPTPARIQRNSRGRRMASKPNHQPQRRQSVVISKCRARRYRRRRPPSHTALA